MYLSNAHKKVYPHTLEYAAEHNEKALFAENRETNQRCMKAIESAISASCYRPDFYNLEAAAKLVLEVYGAERVNILLADTLNKSVSDGRYSRDNREWARSVPIPDDTDCYTNAHPYLLNGFIDKAREVQKTSVLDRLEKKAKTAKEADKQKPDKAKNSLRKRTDEIGG
jgi:hypothetical protein